MVLPLNQYLEENKQGKRQNSQFGADTSLVLA